jgi:hypothetical protein
MAYERQTNIFASLEVQLIASMRSAFSHLDAEIMNACGMKSPPQTILHLLGGKRLKAAASTSLLSLRLA